jgi:hypothetical protein
MGDWKAETESEIIAAQDQALQIIAAQDQALQTKFCASKILQTERANAEYVRSLLRQ